MTRLSFQDFCEQNSESFKEAELMLQIQEFYLLAKEMPPKVDGCPWVLMYSTNKHGFNLNTLIRKVKDVTTPVLILIEPFPNKTDKNRNVKLKNDIDETIFGAYLSDMPKHSRKFSGNGETFVFKIRPKKEVYKWSTNNENRNFFMLDKVDGTEENELTVGNSNGCSAILLNNQLDECRTMACDTFSSPSLIKGEGDGDFQVKRLECWALK